MDNKVNEAPIAIASNLSFDKKRKGSTEESSKYPQKKKSTDKADY